MRRKIFPASGGGGGSGVTTFNTRSGAVTLTKADVTGTSLAASDVSALGATATAGGSLTGNYPNPTITTIPSGATAATQTALDNSTKVSTTAYTDAAVTASQTATATLTNKRVMKRVVTVTQSATPAINTDNMDVASITGLASAPNMSTSLTGSPNAGDTLIIELTDDGTARAITWGSGFVASTVALPTTTVISTLLTVGFRRTAANTAWVCVAAC